MDYFESIPSAKEHDKNQFKYFNIERIPISYTHIMI